jgi:vitamin B12 transporter
MNKTFWFCVMLCCGIITSGFSQNQTDSLEVETLEEVVLTDSRFKLKRENSGKVITKISTEELNRLQGQSIAEIINRTAGIEINGVRSNAAQNLGYFVRGGRNRQVLVMIDGIQLTDPSQIANDYDLRLLNADQVESIEILKGASSTLYGSGAATAVINIKLKEALDKGFNLNLRSTLGSNQSANDNNYAIEDFRNSVSVNGTLDKFSYLASFGQQFTDGLSALEAGSESDPLNAYNGLLKLSYEFSDKLSLRTYGSFDNVDAAFDDSFAGTDADNVSVSEQYRFGISPEFNYNNGSLAVNAAYNHIDRTIESAFPSIFNGNSIVVDAFNRYNFNDQFYTVLGVNFQNNQMESSTIPFGSNDFETSINSDEAHFTIVDPYLNVVYISDFGLNLNAGVRVNNHSQYGTNLVYNINPSYRTDLNFGYLKGLLSYSTAYITPSLFQLFEPGFGNPDLEPEENQTIEVGAELGFKGTGFISLVYFNRNEENFIDFVDTGNFVFQYQNIAEVFIASGLEFVAQLRLNPVINLNANFTYTSVEEDLSLRIPKIMGNARVDYLPFKNTIFSLSYEYNGDRTDSFFNDETFENEIVTLDSFGLLDFYVSQKILGEKMTLFANITNIFNEDYQELFGFTTRGRNVHIGFSLQI